MEKDLCKECEKQIQYCVCSSVESTKVGTFVLVLRHPQEADKDLGTAPIISKILGTRAVVRTGLSWPNLETALKGTKAPLPGSSKNWAVLFLGSQKSYGKVSFENNAHSALVFLDKNGKPLPEQEDLKGLICGLVVLDGSWDQAKALWWRNPWLLKLKRVVLVPKAESQYGNLRKEPRKECLSTLESVAYSISALESRTDHEPYFLKPFQELLEKFKKNNT